MDWYYEDDWYYDEIRGRAALVQKAQPLSLRAVVRGYWGGSAWKEYRSTGGICGTALPGGLKQSGKLPEPVYTLRNNTEAGNRDEHITFHDSINILGPSLAHQIRDISFELYEFGETYAGKRGIIIAESEFEFGLVEGNLILIDELFTPDSSLFWSVEQLRAGYPQPGPTFLVTIHNIT